MTDVKLDLLLDDDTLKWDDPNNVAIVDHTKKIRGVTVSATAPSAGQTLVATSDTTAAWGTAAGNVTGPGATVVGNVAAWGDAAGTELVDAGMLAADIVLDDDTRLTNARTPTSHASTHQVGGADEISVAGLSGLLATPQNPAGHATSHKHGGSDEISTATPTANAIPKAGSDHKLDNGWLNTGTGSSSLILGDDSRLTNSRTPNAHASSHQDGGADEISVAGLSGLLADAQTALAHKTSHQDGGADEISVAGLSGLLADAQTPLAHKASHQDGGADEISVAGLSGALADPQRAGSLATTGSDVVISGAAAPTTGQVLKATSATTATWQTIASGGDVSGPASATDGYVVLFDGAGGKTLKNSTVNPATLVVTSDSRLSDSRTPTSHHASHQHSGSDEIATATAAANAIPKANGAAKLDIGWIPTGTSSTTACIGNDSRLSDARTPSSHAASHQDGGADEISVQGLNGVLADAQIANKIAKTSGTVAISGTAPSANQVLQASSSTAAAWATLSYGDASGPASSISGHLASYNGTGGKTLQDSGYAISDLCLTGDSRLSDARTPTAHSTSHKHGGADEVATATAAANSIPKSGAGGTLGIAWIPTGTSSSTVCIGDDARLSDVRTADKIKTSGTAVTISGTAPSANQVLQASSSTAAAWATLTSWNPFATITTSAATTITATVNTFYEISPPTGATTVTLPTTHAVGDWIWLNHVWATDILKVTCPTGHNINGTGGPITYTLTNTYSGQPGQALLVSTSSTRWLLVAGRLQ